MTPFGQLRSLLQITRSIDIARRYFVTNGFDGALSMLGLIMGFRLSGDVPLAVALSGCLGAAIALAMSGLSSAYISETAERKRELQELEESMLADMGETAHAQAARLAPIVIALVNGLAPLLFALLTTLPLWLAYWGYPLPLPPFDAAITLNFILIFLLGIFLGRISGGFWLLAGLRTVTIAAVTSLLILLLKI
jgi:predicted membrane protein (TIGR00267 family)